MKFLSILYYLFISLNDSTIFSFVITIIAIRIEIKIIPAIILFIIIIIFLNSSLFLNE